MNADNDTALVSAYRKSKATVVTQKGFGLKLGSPLRDRWVTPGVQHVRLELEGISRPLEVSLLKGFWNECAEFMHEDIYEWIASQGLAIPWPSGKPHHFEMARISGTEFRVRRLRSPAGG
ncbi:hypothetical protein [Prosthecobacter vanneervenii]|uniref:Uncharacterized protein n=1 Tax=Prosthecobacter vanneervenii TaxID=48466 RepID=A0A7W7Y8J6_9BACT|nr:hypothetical protein [Prosthecobacter vanneervenii]MBB5031465.1 hypothetical protein [Prosthecobacter vanneervenii]